MAGGAPRFVQAHLPIPNVSIHGVNNCICRYKFTPWLGALVLAVDPNLAKEARTTKDNLSPDREAPTVPRITHNSTRFP